MPKLLVSSNFSATNLAFITMDLKVTDDFDDSLSIDCSAKKPEVEPLGMVF